MFINCPYDEKYKPLFFAIIYLCELYSYDPIFAACDESSGDRMSNIIDCINESKYSIHDISKTKSKEPHFNMPFELGMYYMHINEHDKTKKLLILEGEKHKSDKTLSDLSGLEVKCHSNEIEGVFNCIRPFFNQVGIKNKKSYHRLFLEYMAECLAEIKDRAEENGYDNYLELSPLDFKSYVEEYIELKTNKESKSDE